MQRPIVLICLARPYLGDQRLFVVGRKTNPHPAVHGVSTPFLRAYNDSDISNILPLASDGNGDFDYFHCLNAASADQSTLRDKKKNQA